MMYYPTFDRLFDDFFDTQWSGSNDVMKTDIVEKDGNIQFNMEVPGVNKDDIQIELNDGVLNITASRNQNHDEKDDDGQLIRQERHYGRYSRSFYIGDNVKQEDVKAHFENGELQITVPDKQAAIDNHETISIEQAFDQLEKAGFFIYDFYLDMKNVCVYTKYFKQSGIKISFSFRFNTLQLFYIVDCNPLHF